MARTTKLASLALVVALAGAVLLAALATGAQESQAPDPDPDLRERGEELYSALCAQCHAPDGSGMEMALAPAIAGHEAWYVEAQLDKFQKGWRGLHPQDIAGMRMRPMALWLDVGTETDRDRRAVAAYVASMPKTAPEPTLEGGDPQRGQAFYAPCTACHGPQGTGNQALNAPGLVHTSDWYLLRSLEKFKQGIRGNAPEDVNAQVMRGMVNALPDEQAMKDVVAYIMSLREGTQTSSAGGAAPTAQARP